MGDLQTKFDEFLREYREDRASEAEVRGKVLTSLENLDQHISSVSKSVAEVRDDLANHRESQDAHGLGTQERVRSGYIGWTGVAIAVGGAIISLASLYLMKH